jgi:lipopolysaccharide transport system ATP-binding protein
VDFAEVKKFLDTPVKRYSSGMYVRLAFAVAAHLEPEILVVDEVLAVGDASFQKKCLGKMEQVASQGGRAILFVSHQMQMIVSLCERVIFLQNGKVKCDSPATQSILEYQTVNQQHQAHVHYTNLARRPGDSRATLIRSWIENQHGNITSNIDIGEPFRISFLYEVHDESHGTPYPNIHLYDSHGICAFVSCGEVETEKKPTCGRYRSIFYIPGELLNSGTYAIGVALTFTHGGMHVSFFQKDELLLIITEDCSQLEYRTKTGYYGPWPGIIRPRLEVVITPQQSLTSSIA